MTVLLTALIIADHMVENNKYGERQRQHYPSISLSGSSAPPPFLRAGLHLIKPFNLDHLGLSALFFTTLHLGNATTCAAVPSASSSSYSTTSE